MYDLSNPFNNIAMLLAVEDLPFVPTIEIVLLERIANSVSEKKLLKI